jgi:hypothetical protein
MIGWQNPTRLIGLSACFFATTSCAIAYARSRNGTRLRGTAAVLAVLEALLFLDMALNIRWQLHDLLQRDAVQENLYAQRSGPQLAALIILSTATAAVMGLILRRLRGGTGAIVAVCGAILSLSCWCSEVISLHGVDAVFYRTVCGVMLVSLLWVVCSLMTGLGILWELRTTRVYSIDGTNRTGEDTSSLIDS